MDEFGLDQLAMFRMWNPDPLGQHEANLRDITPALAKVVRRAQADNPGLAFCDRLGPARRPPPTLLARIVTLEIRQGGD